jgi:hypothetical protein
MRSKQGDALARIQRARGSCRTRRESIAGDIDLGALPASTHNVTTVTRFTDRRNSSVASRCHLVGVASTKSTAKDRLRAPTYWLTQEHDLA